VQYAEHDHLVRQEDPGKQSDDQPVGEDPQSPPEILPEKRPSRRLRRDSPTVAQRQREAGQEDERAPNHTSQVQPDPGPEEPHVEEAN
jgi:hypothetical protein